MERGDEQGAGLRLHGQGAMAGSSLASSMASLRGTLPELPVIGSLRAV